MRRIALVTCLTAANLLAAQLAPSQTPSFSAREHRRAHETEIVGELADLLSIPNVASDSANIRRNAAKLIEMMGKRGIQARLLEGKGSPAIFGELKTPGAARTIGFYAHYDGQPVDASKWAS